jgi:DNA repair exonuclease SbcCD nuclease subunit
VIRVLLLADTHLGFDLPSRPRVEKRRRGPDFFANTRLALEPAIHGQVDLVVHGGDLLYRSKVPAGLVLQAIEPLLEVADCGVPVVLVPGNHERSALPYPLLASHENLHVLDRPRTVALEIDGTRLAIGGFPCERDNVRDRFSALVMECGVLDGDADVRLLCLHQTIEGSRVEGFTFRFGADIVRGRDIPSGLAAVLCGHIHRSQTLTRDLSGRQLASPVLYPGSVERTSLAEREEPKGYLILDLEANAESGGRLERWEFRGLPARPMFAVSVDATDLTPEALERSIRDELGRLPADAVVHLRIEGRLEAVSAEVIRAANLRRLHPPTMTVTLHLARANRASRRGAE